MSASRRAVIASAAGLLVGMGGCSETGTGPDLHVSNRTEDDIVLTLRVRRLGNDQTLLEERASIEAQGKKEYQDPIAEDGTFDISVTVDDDYAGSHTWDKPSEAHTLFIFIERATIEFQPAVE